MSTKTVNILKLNQNNYSIWKERMVTLLKEENLWDVVTDEQADQNDEKWIIKNEKARAYIIIAIDENQVIQVHDKTTAANAWQALKKVFDPFLSKVQLIKEISGVHLQEGENLQEHITKLSGLFEKLLDLGDTKLCEESKVKFLLASLPKSYEKHVSEFGKTPEKDLKWSDVCERLLQG